MGQVFIKDGPERYWKRVRRGSEDECWPWLGKINNGYGTVYRNGIETTAHRYGYSLAHGAVPSDCDVDHICRNTLCQNPNHLRLWIDLRMAGCTQSNTGRVRALGPLSRMVRAPAKERPWTDFVDVNPRAK